MRVALLIAIALGTTVLSSWMLAQGQPVDSGPLDLPRVGAGVAADDEEDAPECITFYGSEYEGDGFFWCLD